MSRVARGVLALALLPTVTACPGGEVGATAQAGDVTVRSAVAWTMGEAHSATAGFELTVAGVGDTLVAVSSPAGRAGLHATQGTMRPIAALPLGVGRTMVDGRAVHVMVQDMPADIPVGGTLPLELHFARAGRVTMALPVLRFSEALTALGR